MKRILIISQHFWPESFKINDLATELQRRGFMVAVLTGKPNYPEGKIFKGYGFLRKAIDNYNDIKVYRVPIIPRGGGGNLRLVLNYLSFVISASLFICFHWKRYDSTFVFASSPITQAYPALLHKKIFRSKLIVWLLDLWPESVIAAGGVQNKFIIKVVSHFSNVIYKNCDNLLVQSESFTPLLIDKGVIRERIVFFPNWAEEVFEIGHCVAPSIPVNLFSENKEEGFILLYAGNIGEAQGIDTIINAAALTRQNNHIKWVFVGSGRRYEWLTNRVAELDLNKTVHVLGRFPLDTMPWFYNKADILLLSLKDEFIFSLTVPARLQSYMASGKPVIGSINGEAAKIIRTADCGFVCEAGNSAKLAVLAEEASGMTEKELLKLGQNGQRYYNECFKRVVVIDRLITVFNSRAEN